MHIGLSATICSAVEQFVAKEAELAGRADSQLTVKTMRVSGKGPTGGRTVAHTSTLDGAI